MINLHDLEVKLVPLSLIKEAENNSRKHSQKQIENLAKNIQEFGFTAPALIDEHNNLIAGHCRKYALEYLKADAMPCRVIKNLTDTQIKALIIADNQQALNAEWDIDQLKTELSELQDLDFDIDILGFDDVFLDDLLSFGDFSEAQCDEDEVPEIVDDPVSKPGDVWLLGDHRVMCGDSTSIDDVEKLMIGENADMIFTDPMYNDHTNGFVATINAMNVKHIVLMTTFRQAISIINESGWHFKFDCVLYFKTPSSMMNKKSPYYLHKNVFYLTNDTDQTIFNCDNACGVFSEKGYYPSVIEAKKNTQDEHGLAKPVECLVKILSGYKAKSIIDLFMGSGSTLIACEQTNRKCYGIEIDQNYCDAIIKRWQNFTGKDAILESTCETFNKLKENKNGQEKIN